MLELTHSLRPEVAAALAGLKPAALKRAIGTGLMRGVALIKGQIEKDRFTGKGPFVASLQRLGVDTGRLRKSIRTYQSPAIKEVNGALVTSIGSNVEYMAPHEFGFSGKVNVRAHEVTMTKLFGRKLAQPLRFSRLASVRQVKIPERRPIRAGIAENMPILEREIIREVTRKN